MSPCIKTLKAIRPKIRPEPARQPLSPPPKQYAATAGNSEAETARGTLRPMKWEPSPPMTLGVAAAACVRLIVWCRDYGHQVEPEPL